MKRTMALAGGLGFVLAGLVGCATGPYGANPKISILGDSYSTFEGAIPKGYAIYYHKPPKAFHGVEKPEDCWWGIVASNLNGRIERNDSWSGATVCNTGYGRRDATFCSFVTRTGRLGDPDLILVMGGTNDAWAGSPIGEYKYEDWTERDFKTFRPAMAKMFADLAKNYPRAKVVFILNTGLGKGINDSAHEICKHYGVKCIDLKKFDLQKEHRGHPTAKGMKEIAAQVTAELGM